MQNNLVYTVTHKERDCKDDLKLVKNDDSIGKLILLSEIKSFSGLFNDLAKKETSLQLQGIMSQNSV